MIYRIPIRIHIQISCELANLSYLRKNISYSKKPGQSEQFENKTDACFRTQRGKINIDGEEIEFYLSKNMRG